ncbi:MAG: hypothetical protein PHG16_00575 [Lachnospiraceae bacterium]|nr:hypothetical protein [Lachnospiraceae bacterium]
MKKLWIKFSDERNRTYSIKTTIWLDEEKNQKYVSKEAVYPEGSKHLQEMVSYYQKLTDVCDGSRMCPVEVRGQALWFPYIEGDSLEDHYRICMKQDNKEAFCNLLDKQVAWLTGKKENLCMFHGTEQFHDIFGDSAVFEGRQGVKIANFDGIPGNIIFDNDTPTFIDYEWVFEGSFPYELLIYHCIRDMYYHIQQLESFITLQEVLKYVKVTVPIEALEQAYKNFHRYVISEKNGKSFAGTKSGSLKNSQNVQETLEELKHAHQEWELCANNWKAAAQSRDEIAKINDEIEGYWRQSSQANALLNKQLLDKDKELQEKQNEITSHLAEIEEYRCVVEHWKSSYESVVNSKAWRLVRKIKKIFGRA